MSNESTAVEQASNHAEDRNVLQTDKEAAESAEKYRKTSFIGYFFPILPKERKRVLMMIAMFCCISFTYTFLRIFKDRIVYSVLDNTETKHWLKLFCFLATQFLVIFSQNISSKSDFNTAFASLTLYFAGFLVLNTVAIFISQFLPIFGNDTFADSMFVSSSMGPRGLSFLYPLVLVFNFLPYSVFYVLAEVVGSLMVSFCFMTYLNNNTTENQNKRFVKVLYFFSNMFSFFSSLAARAWTNHYKNKPKADSDKFFYIFSLGAVALYLVVLLIKKVLEKELQNKIVISTTAPKKAGSKKKKLGFKDSLALMFNSKFLLYMSLLSCFYNISANFFDTANSSGMSASANFYSEDKSSYSTIFKSTDGICTSLLTCVIIISPLTFIPDTYGIGVFACIPLVISVLGALVQFVFTIINYPITGNDVVRPFNKLSDYAVFSPEIEQAKPRWESIAGTATQIAIKVSKYAFYDIIKEAISMKIDPELRPLFKGVFDGSIAKFGKSAGSMYGIIMYSIFESNDARFYFPITTIIILIFAAIWIYAIRYLSKAFNKAKEADTYIDPDLTSEIKLI